MSSTAGDAPAEPTPRRLAYETLMPSHQQAILERLGELLCEARKPWVLLAEQRERVLAAVLDD